MRLAYRFVLPLAALSLSCGNNTAPPNPQLIDSGASNGDAADTNRPDATPLPIPENCEGGRVTHVVAGQIYRSTLAATVTTENVSAALNSLSAGSDEWASASPGGDWLVMETTRFHAECDGWACLAVVQGDLSAGEVVTIDGSIVHGDDLSAIATGGNRIVYPMSGGPHEKDLYVTNKSNGSWSTPVLLTGSSSSPYNLQPAISADGSKVVFDCGEDPYGQPPTKICEVNTDGSDFRVVWTPEQGGGSDAPGRSDVALHHADYFSDGSIVFEADWTGEQIWRLEGSGPPVRIAGQYSNDNSPCVMDNDCIVSLWLERPNSEGKHEMKVMDSQGGSFSMVRIDVDITDTGTYCSL